MAKLVVVYTDEDRFTGLENCRRADRKETAEAFLSAKFRPVRMEGDGLKLICYFLKAEVAELDKILMHSPEKFCPSYPDVITGQNYWKDAYALLKNIQKSAMSDVRSNGQ